MKERTNEGKQFCCRQLHDQKRPHGVVSNNFSRTHATGWMMPLRVRALEHLKCSLSPLSFFFPRCHLPGVTLLPRCLCTKCTQSLTWFRASRCIWKCSRDAEVLTYQSKVCMHGYSWRAFKSSSFFFRVSPATFAP